LARWRSLSFFITENNGKNRKIQKFARLRQAPAATLTLTLTLTFLNTICFGSRTLAKLFHYRKKQKLLACGKRLRQP